MSNKATERGLPPEDQAVHQMLSLELADFIKHGYPAESGMCVAVRRVPNGDVVAVPPAVFQALEKQAAGAVKLISYSESECPFDDWSTTMRGRVLLSASKVVRSNDLQPDWLAGVTFETLYGWGNAYVVETDGDDVKVRSLSAWIS